MTFRGPVYTIPPPPVRTPEWIPPNLLLTLRASLPKVSAYDWPHPPPIYHYTPEWNFQQDRNPVLFAPLPKVSTYEFPHPPPVWRTPEWFVQNYRLLQFAALPKISTYDWPHPPIVGHSFEWLWQNLTIRLPAVIVQAPFIGYDFGKAPPIYRAPDWFTQNILLTNTAQLPKVSTYDWPHPPPIYHYSPEWNFQQDRNPVLFAPLPNVSTYDWPHPPVVGHPAEWLFENPINLLPPTPPPPGTDQTFNRLVIHLGWMMNR